MWRLSEAQESLAVCAVSALLAEIRDISSGYNVTMHLNPYGMGIVSITN